VAKVFKYIIERDNFDLAILGKQSIDDDSNQTGQLLAAMLDFPSATFCSEINLQDGKAIVIREIDAGL
jgi:electron transfer flavoprotein beta subunit